MPCGRPLRPQRGVSQVVEDDIEALQDRLSRAVAAKELLEAQLLEEEPSYSSHWAMIHGGNMFRGEL